MQGDFFLGGYPANIADHDNEEGCSHNHNPSRGFFDATGQAEMPGEVGIPTIATPGSPPSMPGSRVPPQIPADHFPCLHS